MLKALLFSFLALFSFAAHAETATDCQIMAESYVVDMDSTQPASYMGRTREGELVFHVNAELRGRRTIFEVVLKPAECEYVSVRSL